MMYGIECDKIILNNIFRNRENAQHYADTLNEKIGCREYEVVELYVADEEG